MRKLSAPAHVEFAGFMTSVFVDNLQSRETAPIFQKYGLVNLDPNAWYPTQPFMDAMNELASKSNLSSNLIAIGLEVGRTAPMPPHLDNPTLEDALMFWDASYKAVHRNHNGDIGGIACEKVKAKHYKTYHDHLYPDDFSYGIAYGFAKRFLPEGSTFTVKYEDKRPRRDAGNAPVTIIHVIWE